MRKNINANDVSFSFYCFFFFCCWSFSIETMVAARHGICMNRYENQCKIDFDIIIVDWTVFFVRFFFISISFRMIANKRKINKTESANEFYASISIFWYVFMHLIIMTKNIWVEKSKSMIFNGQMVPLCAKNTKKWFVLTIYSICPSAIQLTSQVMVTDDK